MGIYDQNLDKNAANHVPISPLTFIERSATAHPDRVALIHGELRRTWAQAYTRSRRLASALLARGIKTGETVSVMGANTPEMFEAHFGVPMSGAVLNAINTRLDAPAVAFILEHAEAKIVLVDREFSEIMEKAVGSMDHKPLVIDIDDPNYEGGKLIGELDYEALLAEGDPEFVTQAPKDEWDGIALNYTSGTTGNPKGVVYHHRGAFLNAVSNLMVWNVSGPPTYLWTLPMFHCNGWCFPWSLAAQGGTSVCLRKVRDVEILGAIREHHVSHLCGAPVVLSLIANADDSLKQGIDHTVEVMTAGAAPPAAVIEAMESGGFHVTHVYGLTETYGPSVVCVEQPDWSELPIDEQATLKARQGLRYPMLEGLMVADPDTLEPVPKDGETIGEIFMRGNNVMKGYLKNPSASEECFKGGWFHSGDLAVWYEDSYVQIKDRSKDIIISGGENISSIEVEGTLFKHPKIMDAAVVAIPHEKWGETPCAFVTLRSGESMTEQDVIEYCRANLARFKAPGKVIFGPIAKTSTGKVQKFKLREQAGSM